MRAIYDELHFGPVNVFGSGDVAHTEGSRNLARELIKLIEERHHDYFCEPAERPKP